MGVKFLEWNVLYTNKDLQGIADIVHMNNPDIVGLCEFLPSAEDMARALSDKTGRPFRVQPGRDGWQGYGTDIFFDSEKWRALEGGAERISCASLGGSRAANWVVLRHR